MNHHPLDGRNDVESSTARSPRHSGYPLGNDSRRGCLLHSVILLIILAAPGRGQNAPEAPGALGARTGGATPAGIVAPCDVCLVDSIACGDTVRGSLPTTECALGDGRFVDVYRLRVPSTGDLAVSLVSTSFDTFLYLMDERCDLVAANDDCGGTLNSCLELTGLSAGIYHVIVSSFSPGARGTYTLRLTCPGIQICPDCESGSLSCNDSVESDLRDSDCTLPGPDGPVNYWRLTLAEPTELVLRAESASLDPVLLVADEDCNELARNDDCQRLGLHSCLRITLDSGLFFVGVSTYYSEDRGPYLLSLRCGHGSLRTPGDCDGNGRIELTDGICVLRHLFDSSLELPCGESLRDSGNLLLLDIDANGAVELTDGIRLFQYLFAGAAAPPSCEAPDCRRCVIIDGCQEDACRIGDRP